MNGFVQISDSRSETRRGGGEIFEHEELRIDIFKIKCLKILR